MHTFRTSARHAMKLVAWALLLVAPFYASAEETPQIRHPHADLPSAAVQGEYVGELTTEAGKQRFGVQVIARADDRYEAVAYVGGLPGAGWDRAEPKRFDGQKTDNDDARFETDKYTATISNGKVTVVDAEGKTLGVLERVERASPTLGAKPPEGAVVLFDLSAEKNDFPGAKLQPGLGLREGTNSKTKMGSGRLHLEFMLPLMPAASGQNRGNSGVYLQSRYEVQVLDSFGLEGKNNECGGIYSIKAPDVNMCLPPLQWQTYDIDFTAARYENGQQVAPPRITVQHNGVLIHDDVELPRTTTAAPLAAGSEPGPLHLQDHGSLVIYRNIWFIPK